MLSIDSLHVSYGGVQAVRGVSMEIPDGKVVAVLGSNGAGKTTLLRTISGTLKLHRGRVESGSVRFDGTDVGSREARSVPSKVSDPDSTRPRWSRNVPETVRSRVVFPAPLLPRTATTLPSGTSMDTPRTACTAPP